MSCEHALFAILQSAKDNAHCSTVSTESDRKLCVFRESVNSDLPHITTKRPFSQAASAIVHFHDHHHRHSSRTGGRRRIDFMPSSADQSLIADPRSIA